MFANEAGLEAKTAKVLVRPEFRVRVEELMRGTWREPVIALRLSDDALGFDVPGRRNDGTVKGKRLIRRFFWNILRGIGTAASAVVLIFLNQLGAANLFKREVKVTGPQNALALGLTDQLRGARGPWLVCSPSYIALVDTGPTSNDPATAPAPQVRWQARISDGLRVRFQRPQLIAWPDGSKFAFGLHKGEDEYLRSRLDPTGAVRWQG